MQQPRASLIATPEPARTPRHTRWGRTAGVALLGLALLAQAQAGPVLDRIERNGRITLGHRESSVPFSFLDAQKQPVGYAIDLCLKLADAVRQRLKLKALPHRFVPVTSGNRLDKVASGEVDLECGSTTNNADRRTKVAFTVPHYIAGARVLVRADHPAQELRDFDGQKLVSTKGTTPLKALDNANRTGLLRIQILEAPDHAKAVEMVERGEADGFVMDDVLLFGLAAGRPDPSKLKVVGKFLTIEPLGIMFSKDDPEFKAIIDEEMKRLIRSREIYALVDRWMMKPIPPNNRSLNLPLNYLTRDFWKFPSDQIPG
jgi:ABC-type amino acid transport substrate-binding protein